MKALVLGLGISGQSACKFLEKKGVAVVGVDDQLKPDWIEDLKGFDLFVPSPGIPRTHRLYQMAKDMGIPIKGEVQLILEEIKIPCIGVTGSNGKTTTVKMIEHCLNACGKKAKAVGNVGVPLSQIQGDEILVVELSSFQLETFSAKVLDVGIILNIAENHMDRYTSFRQYAQTKADLQFCVKKDGVLLVHREVDASLFCQLYHPYEGDNTKAAQLACSYFGVEEKGFLQALQSFSKPAHRLEFVATLNGVSYYNDSKGTSVHAMLYALSGFKKDVILIAGGLDKGLSFEPLQNVVEKLSCVIVFGRAREKIANTLKHLVTVHAVETVREAVEKAKALARKNETVLFSPGCASFDAFKNYEERGDEFKCCVLR